MFLSVLSYVEVSVAKKQGEEKCGRNKLPCFQVFFFWKYWEVIFKQECKTEYVTILLRVIYC